MLVSIQGLLEPYSKSRNFFGAMSAIDILSSTRLLEIPFRTGLLWQYAYLNAGARRERAILKAADGFLGRTTWDRAHTTFCNTAAQYFYVDEIMRKPFYESFWQIGNCERYTLLYTNAGQPRRGTEDVLLAVSLLKQEFPCVKLRLAGTLTSRSGYGRFLRNRIKTLDLENNVELLGYLDAESMSRELLRANVFVLSSYIENSPNSLAEAMLMGMPCIASSVGGIPDMIEDGRSGLLVPASDAPLLAFRIRQVFRDEETAVRLGKSARVRASERHDPVSVTKQLMSAYETTYRMVSDR